VETIRTGSLAARRAILALAAAFLAYKTLIFYHDALSHFLLDYNEANWGRYWPNRFWLLLHIGGATLALFSGPFQLWSGLRRRHLAVHRWTGRLFITGVLSSGGAAFYLSFHAPPRSFGVALFVLAAAWWITAGMAVAAIKKRRITVHKEWMIRAYVVTLAFVMFRWWLTWLIWSAFGESRLAVILWASWTLPLIVTEVFLRHGRRLRPSAPRAAIERETHVTSR